MAQLPAKQDQYVKYAEKDSKGRNIANSIDKNNDAIELAKALGMHLVFIPYGPSSSGTLSVDDLKLVKDTHRVIVYDYQYIYFETKFSSTQKTFTLVRNGTSYRSYYEVTIDLTNGNWSVSHYDFGNPIYRHFLKISWEGSSKHFWFDFYSDRKTAYDESSFKSFLEGKGYINSNNGLQGNYGVTATTSHISLTSATSFYYIRCFCYTSYGLIFVTGAQDTYTLDFTNGSISSNTTYIQKPSDKTYIFTDEVHSINS